MCNLHVAGFESFGGNFVPGVAEDHFRLQLAVKPFSEQPSASLQFMGGDLDIMRKMIVLLEMLIVVLTHMNVSLAGPPIAIEMIQRAEPVNFEKEILPILQKNCLACHSASEKQGSLILESAQGILKGGDTGAAVVPGKGLDSLLLKVASHQIEPVMPPEGNDVAASTLTPQELGLLKLWIDQGAIGSGGIDSLSPKQMNRLPRGFVAVQGLALTQDGQHVAFSRGNQILLHHVPTGQLLTQLTDPALADSTGVAHRDLVQSLTFNVDGDLLASGGFREVKLWRRPKDVQKLSIAAGVNASVMAMSPDRSLIAANGPNNTIQIRRAADGAAGPVMNSHTDVVTSLRFTDDGSTLVSGSLDQSICVWNVTDGAMVGKIETPTPVNVVELVRMAEPTEQNPLPQFWIVSGGGDNVMRVWEMPAATHRSPSSIANLERTVSSRDTRLLAMLDKAGNVRIISVQPTQINVVEKDIAAWKVEGGISSLAFVRRAGTAEPNADNLKDSYNVLIGTPDGSVQLWSLAETKLLSVWKAGSSPIRSVAGSVDGTMAVSGAEDGSTYLWKMNQPAAAPMETSVGETFEVTITSPSRKQIASTGVKDGQPAIVIRSTESNKITHVLTGHTGSILSLAFSNDDARLVTGGDDRTLRIWDLRNAAAPEIKKIEGLAANVTTVGSNADGSQVLAGFADNSLKMFNTADATVLKEFVGHSGSITASGFWNNQPFSVSLDSTVRFWNAADGAQTRAFSLPVPPTAVTVSNDGQRMAFGGADNQVRIYQTDNGGVLQTLQGFAAAATSLNFSPDAQLLSVINADGRVSIYNATTGRLREAFVDPKVKSAVFSADATGIIVAREGDGMASEPMRFLQNLDGSTQSVRGTAFHPNNQTVYVAVADGTLRGHSVQNGQATFSTNHGAAINDLAISMDGQVLATAGDNNVVRLWNASGAAVAPQQLAGFTGPVRRVAFSTDAKQILGVADGEKPTTQLHDLPTGTLLQRFSGHTGTAAGCVLLPPVTDGVSQIPGTMALTASPGGVYQWPVTSWKQIAGHNGVITSLARASKTAGQVFSGSLDNTIRRWNLDNGQAMQQYNHGGAVHAIAVSPDVDRIASASDNRTAKLFNINGQQIAELRGDIRRKIALTRAQQIETASNARLNIAKQQADAAEKDLPVKTTAEKTLADMLATATADVQTKKTAMGTTFNEKTVAEKAAIDASAAAKTALTAKTMAEQSAKDASSAVTGIQARLTRLTQASNAEPQNESLKQKVAAAQAEMEAATTKSTQMAAAVQAPTDAATQMATLANEAAKKLETVQKPYNDAVAALKTAEAAQNLLSQQQALAAKELQAATELVPVRKEAVTRAEALLAEAKVGVEAANKSLLDSDLPQRSVAFSPDGSVLVTGGDFGSLHTWDGKTGGAIGSFVGHTGPVKSVTFLDDRTLASASDDQTIRIWDANPGWILERTIGSQDDSTTIAHRVTAVDFNADSSQILVAGGIPSRRGELQVFNTADGSRVFSLPQAHDDVIYAARFSPDGKRIASGGADKYLRTFDIATSQQIRRFEGHTSYVLGVAWKRDGQLLASAGADNTVKVWNAETGDQQRTIETFRRHVTAVQFIGETDNIVTSCGDKQMRIHNAANGGQVRLFNTPTSWLHTVAATPDNAVAAAGDAIGNVYLWNGNNGQQLRVLGVQATEK